MAVDPSGREAITHFRVLVRFGNYTFLECRLETGRTHQIRVHLAYLGYPLLGDALYGGDQSILHEQALHCGGVRFPEPAEGTEIILQAPLRPEMRTFLQGGSL